MAAVNICGFVSQLFSRIKGGGRGKERGRKRPTGASVEAVLGSLPSTREEYGCGKGVVIEHVYDSKLDLKNLANGGVFVVFSATTAFPLFRPSSFTKKWRRDRCHVFSSSLKSVEL